MKKIILTTPDYLTKDGLPKNTGVSLIVCFLGSVLFMEKEQEAPMETIIQKLRQKNVNIFGDSEVTASETRAVKMLRKEFEKWKDGNGILVITNKHIIEAVGAQLKKELGTASVEIFHSNAKPIKDTGEDASGASPSNMETQTTSVGSHY